MKYISSIGDEKKKKALLGALVADAASLPLHWIYDPQKLRDAISSTDKYKCEFNSVFSCPYYSPKDFPGHYELGQPSPNGEQLLAMFDIVYECGNDDQNGDNYAAKFRTWLNSYTGRKDGPAEIFEKNYDNGLRYPKCGADDDQAMVFFKAIVAYIFNVELEPLVRFHQNNDIAADCAEFYFSLLNAAGNFHGEKSIRSLYNELKGDASVSLKEHLDFLEINLESPTNEFAVAWGEKFKSGSSSMVPISCHNPQALLRVLHVIFRAESFEDGIRNNILVAGSNVLSGIAVGAILALYYDIPEEWIQQTKCIQE